MWRAMICTHPPNWRSPRHWLDALQGPDEGGLGDLLRLQGAGHAPGAGPQHVGVVAAEQLAVGLEVARLDSPHQRAVALHLSCRNGHRKLPWAAVAVSREGYPATCPPRSNLSRPALPVCPAGRPARSAFTSASGRSRRPVDDEPVAARGPSRTRVSPASSARRRRPWHTDAGSARQSTTRDGASEKRAAWPAADVDLEADAGRDGHLGQGHAQPAVGDVVDAGQQVVGHQAPDDLAQPGVGGEVEGGQLAAEVAPVRRPSGTRPGRWGRWPRRPAGRCSAPSTRPDARRAAGRGRRSARPCRPPAWGRCRARPTRCRG